jgi:hypothetical protein
VSVVDPQFIVSDTTVLTVELATTIPAGVNLAVAGLGMHFDFNFN